MTQRDMAILTILVIFGIIVVGYWQYRADKKRAAATLIKPVPQAPLTPTQQASAQAQAQADIQAQRNIAAERNPQGTDPRNNVP